MARSCATCLAIQPSAMVGNVLVVVEKWEQVQNTVRHWFLQSDATKESPEFQSNADLPISSKSVYLDERFIQRRKHSVHTGEWTTQRREVLISSNSPSLNLSTYSTCINKSRDFLLWSILAGRISNIYMCRDKNWSIIEFHNAHSTTFTCQYCSDILGGRSLVRARHSESRREKLRGRWTLLFCYCSHAGGDTLEALRTVETNVLIQRGCSHIGSSEDGGHYYSNSKELTLEPTLEFARSREEVHCEPQLELVTLFTRPSEGWPLHLLVLLTLVIESNTTCKAWELE